MTESIISSCVYHAINNRLTVPIKSMIVYDLFFPKDLMIGDWKNATAFIRVAFKNGKYSACSKWIFPTEFYGTREYFKLIAMISNEIDVIEKDLVIAQIKSN
jgi:hypothetical protein